MKKEMKGKMMMDEKEMKPMKPMMKKPMANPKKLMLHQRIARGEKLNVGAKKKMSKRRV